MGIGTVLLLPITPPHLLPSPQVFGQVAPVDFVDYGISNSGDVTVAYIRMVTPTGAAEAVRVLREYGQT